MFQSEGFEWCTLSCNKPIHSDCMVSTVILARYVLATVFCRLNNLFLSPQGLPQTTDHLKVINLDFWSTRRGHKHTPTIERDRFNRRLTTFGPVAAPVEKQRQGHLPVVPRAVGKSGFLPATTIYLRDKSLSHCPKPAISTCVGHFRPFLTMFDDEPGVVRQGKGDGRRRVPQSRLSLSRSSGVCLSARAQV